MSWWQVFLALPELLKLVNNLIKGWEEAEKKSKIKDDLKAINEAFKNKDSDLLNSVFNNRVRSSRSTKDGN